MPNKKRFKIYAAVFLVLIKEGKILMHKRINTDYMNNKYSLVSGHIEFKETAKESMIRETKEEIGIDIKPKDLDVCHVLHRYRPDRTYIDLFFKCEKWDGIPENTEKEKCEEIKYFSLDNLPDNIVPEIKFALENIQKGNYYGEYGWNSFK